ncbi:MULTISPECIES: hypothetical protein [unclassified Streptomyces]|uniref:hypothetical protein n=1 Tax=unclassified Streptomyces TaxID=2593676 RepID=UPI0037FF6B30
MLRRVSTVLAGALVAGVIATGGAAAAPAPEHGQRMHQSQGQHKRVGSDHRRTRVEVRIEGARRDGGKRKNRQEREDEREGLFLVGRLLHALLGGHFLYGHGGL